VQPGFAPFFHATKDEPAFIGTNNDDTDSPVSSNEVLKGRKRRGSDPQVRTSHDETRLLLIVAEAALSSHARPRRRRRRDTKLDATARAAIKQQSTHGKTFRELATRYGVSHKTISNIVHDDSDARAA
jgi:hypothetical protein